MILLHIFELKIWFILTNFFIRYTFFAHYPIFNVDFLWFQCMFLSLVYFDNFLDLLHLLLHYVTWILKHLARVMCVSILKIKNKIFQLVF